MPEGCEEFCVCTVDGEVDCEQGACRDNAYCGTDREGNYGCHCYDGYNQNGQDECELSKCSLIPKQNINDAKV